MSQLKNLIKERDALKASNEAKDARIASLLSEIEELRRG